MAPLLITRFYMLDQGIFAFNLKYLFIMGLWSGDDLSRNQRIIYIMYEATLHFLHILMFVVTAIGAYEHREDITLLLTNLDKILVTYNFYFKTVLFVINRYKLKNLIEDIKASDDILTYDKRKLMVNVVLILSGSAVAVTGSFSAFSLYKGEMTVEAWMPFDPLQSQKHLILSAQILAVLFVPGMLRAFAIEGLVCSLIMYLCYQLKDLQSTIKNLEYTTETDIETRRKLKEAIKKHIRLVRYGNILESAFREYFLVQQLAVTMELCLNAVMVTMVTNLTLLITFAGYLSIALFNAYIYSYLGNELILQSEGIAMAGYESSWTTWPLDMQQDLLILIMAAQRPLALSSGGLSLVCKETYSQTLYNGYSIFAVLNDMVD